MAVTTGRGSKKARKKPRGLSLRDRVELDLPLNIEQASTVSQLSPSTIYNYIKEGKIRRAGRTGRVLILPSSLREFDQRRRAR